MGERVSSVLKVTAESVEASDIPKLAEFMASFPEETRPADFWFRRFAFWWETNPAFNETINRGCVLRSEGRIVGFIGIIPSDFQLCGRPDKSWTITTWRVLPEHRGKQSLVLLERCLRDFKSGIMLSTTPTERAGKLLRLYQFKLIPRREEASAVRILELGNFLKSRWKLKGFGAGVASAAGAVWDACSNSGFSRSKKHPDFQLRELASVGPEFDPLWKRLSGRFPTTLVRTAEVLNRYCFENPSGRKILAGLFRQNELIAFGIFSLFESEGSKRLEALDIFGDFQDQEAGNAFASGVLELGRFKTADWIKVPLFVPEWKDCFARLGFQIRREEGRRQLFRLDQPEELTAEDSYFTNFLGDIGM